MHGHRFSAVVILVASIISIGWTAQAIAVSTNGGYHLTGPYTHNNLAIYLIHREDSDSEPVPLTLGEAMAQGLVKVTETDDIEELVVRNLGEREVFIQSGDLCQGWQAGSRLDRQHDPSPEFGVTFLSVLFAWSTGGGPGVGQERTTEFSASTMRMPLQAARMAIAKRVWREMEYEADRPVHLDTGRQRSQGEGLQGQVWDSIRKGSGETWLSCGGGRYGRTLAFKPAAVA